MKSKQERGIVLSPDYSLHGRTAIFNELVNPLELRKYLLYWDKIDIPLCGVVSLTNDDVDYLEQIGFVCRSRFDIAKTTRIQGSGQWKNIGFPFELAIEISNAHEATYRKNQEQSPGQWCKGYLQHELARPSEFSTEGVEIELYDSLPVPRSNTPFDDILEFKDKRTAELIAFRTHMDDIREKVITSGDIPRKRSTERLKLESSINDLTTLMRERKMRIAKDSIKSVISNVGEVAASVAAGQFAGISLGFTSAYTGLTAGGLKIGYLLYNSRSNPYPNELNYIRSTITNFKTE